MHPFFWSMWYESLEPRDSRQGDFRDEEGFEEAYASADRGEVT